MSQPLRVCDRSKKKGEKTEKLREYRKSIEGEPRERERESIESIERVSRESIERVLREYRESIKREY